MTRAGQPLSRINRLFCLVFPVGPTCCSSHLLLSSIWGLGEPQESHLWRTPLYPQPARPPRTPRLEPSRPFPRERGGALFVLLGERRLSETIWSLT